jgi:ABC-type sugar transport system ATPase subunit
VIEVTNVVKRYGATHVLNGATFRIAGGQLTTILGPSGSGKSTMLSGILALTLNAAASSPK